MTDKFDRSYYGYTFQRDSSIYALFFGTRSKLTEDDINETQWNLIDNVASLMRNRYSSGVFSNFTVSPTEHRGIFTANSVKPISFLVDGYEIQTGCNFIPSQESYPGLLSNDNRLIFKLDPSDEVQRFDLAFIEIWFEVISYSDDLRKFGGMDTPLMVNNLLDGRIGEETARRVQLRWRLRTAKGVTAMEGVTAQSWNGEDSLVNYSKIPGDKIYAADIGIQRLEDTTLKSPGIVYGIPLFLVRRRANDDYVNIDDIMIVAPMSSYQDLTVRKLTVEDGLDVGQNITVEGDLVVKGFISGDTGATVNYIHDQLVESEIWEIAHNTDKFPSVTIVDDNGDEIIGDVNYVDSNRIIIEFTVPLIGKAFLN